MSWFKNNNQAQILSTTNDLRQIAADLRQDRSGFVSAVNAELSAAEKSLTDFDQGMDTLSREAVKAEEQIAKSLAALDDNFTNS